MKKSGNKEKLLSWQERLKDNEAAYGAALEEMDKRELLYGGDNELRPLTDKDKNSNGDNNRAYHVRNITAEIIEAQINSDIPQPKVTARRRQDEGKAKLIENMLRNELNHLPFELLNDMMERTVPIQGGGFFLVEWDNTQRSHMTVGEVTVSVRHPKTVIPQDGVYSSVEDMDFIILKVPQTKAYIKRRYDVDLEDEAESEPEIKSSGEAAPVNDMVTQYMAYYRNDKGGIGLYSWVNDRELIDLEDYQARRLKRCDRCGALEPVSGTEVGGDLVTLQSPRGDSSPEGEPLAVKKVWREGDPCPYCGGTKFTEGPEEFEEVFIPITLSDGTVIPGASASVDKDGQPYLKPNKLPFYKPDVYPVVLQRNVSVFGKLLGDSDVDKIRDQQNTLNRVETKIIDRIVKAGTRITLPDEASCTVDPRDSMVWRLNDPSKKAMIDVYDFTGDLQYELLYGAQVYEEARQIIGITDSFQGRQDTTANSGRAKEFAAAQTAGRLESKRRMKESAYADLFRLMFLFKLAYADEPRPVVYTDSKGDTEYGEFNRYDFLETDKAGEYFWNDMFLFSCDSSAPLANNRKGCGLRL